MSFIGSVSEGKFYHPGYFLAHEECTRETMQFNQEGATTADSGAKYVPMGTLYSVTTGTGNDAVTDYIGFAYEDVDVTRGDMPGSVVTSGTVYIDRLPAELAAAAKTALEAKGFKFIAAAPTITRPAWTNS